MSLSNENNKQTYTPATPTTEFDFPYPYFDANDIRVIHEDSAGVITVYDDETGFTVTATNGDPANGATIDTTATGSFTSGDTITLSREVPYTQEYDLQDGASIDPTALNTALDRTVAQSQQIVGDGARHISHPITDPDGLSYETPAVTGRASKAIGWDASGNVVALNLANSGTVSGNESAGISVTNNVISAKVDDSTVEFSSGDIAIKDGGITDAKINDVAATKITGEVATAQVADDAVTYAKIQDVSTNLRALGGITSGTVTEIPIDNDLSSVSATHNELATSKSIKDYVDGAPNFVPTSYAGEESITLPNGLIMKTGSTATAAASGTITFTPEFPTAIVSVTACPFETAGATYLSVTAQSKLSFNYTASTVIDRVQWFAIGY